MASPELEIPAREELGGGVFLKTLGFFGKLGQRKGREFIGGMLCDMTELPLQQC